MRNRRTPVAGSIVAQLALALVTVRLDDVRVDRPHLTIALGCALLALVVGALVLRRIESGMLRLVLAFAAERKPRPAVRRAAPLLLVAASAAELVYGLFRPNRPPPLAFA